MDEWIRRLCFTNPVGTWGVLDVCPLFRLRWCGLYGCGLGRGLGPLVWMVWVVL